MKSKLFLSLFLLFCSPLFASEQPTVSCYSVRNNEPSLMAKLSPSKGGKFSLTYWTQGEAVTIANLSCKFSAEIPYVFSCKGPDHEGSRDYHMNADLREEVVYRASEVRRSITVTVNRIKDSAEADGFDLEGYVMALFNDSGDFKGHCEAR